MWFLHTAYHNTDGELPVSVHQVTSLSDSFAEAAKELAYDVVDYNGRSMIGKMEFSCTSHFFSGFV